VIVWGVKKFRFFLEGTKFTVFTDHSSLQWLLQSKEEKQGRLARWALSLQQFDFEIVHVPGTKSRAADALSRHPLPTVTSITVQRIQWNLEQKKDSNILTHLHGKPNNFGVEDEVIYRLTKFLRNPRRNKNSYSGSKTSATADNH
jgi:hypothetical protein